MQPTSIHLILITGLSMGLGYTLSSSPAVGYPAGATVSTGSNPIRSAAGSMHLSDDLSHSDVLTAPGTHDLIITDLIAGLNQTSDYCDGNGRLRIQDSAGVTYGEFAVYMTHMDNAHPTSTTLAAVSGIRIPAGTSVDLTWEWSRSQCGSDNYNLRYTISGYLSEP